jgi:putative protease
MDDLIKDQEEREGAERGDRSGQRILIGRVTHFYDKLKVVAIDLIGNLRVGDTIEIENVEEAVRQKVTSMQINRKEVNEASKGDSVGILVDRSIMKGSKVYKIE